VIMAKDRFQYWLRLLEIESIRDRQIAAACPSGVQTMIVAGVLARESIGKANPLRDGTQAWEKNKPEESRRDFTGKRAWKT
jgi:rhodanese-related sulfurtransferase